jgi:hypothetical protein
MDKFARLLDACGLFAEAALKADFTQGRPQRSFERIPTSAYVPDDKTVEQMKRRMFERRPSDLPPAELDASLVSALVVGKNEVLVSGVAGTVKPAGTKIRIQNMDRAIGLITISNPDGSFRANLPGGPDDNISVQAITDAGTSKPARLLVGTGLTKRELRMRRIEDERRKVREKYFPETVEKPAVTEQWSGSLAGLNAHIEDVLKASNLAPEQRVGATYAASFFYEAPRIIERINASPEGKDESWNDLMRKVFSGVGVLIALDPSLNEPIKSVLNEMVAPVFEKSIPDIKPAVLDEKFQKARADSMRQLENALKHYLVLPEKYDIAELPSRRTDVDRAWRPPAPIDDDEISMAGIDSKNPIVGAAYLFYIEKQPLVAILDRNPKLFAKLGVKEPSDLLKKIQIVIVQLCDNAPLYGMSQASCRFLAHECGIEWRAMMGSTKGIFKAAPVAQVKEKPTKEKPTKEKILNQTTKLPIIEPEPESDVYHPRVSGDISIDEAVQSFIEDMKAEGKSTFTMDDAVDIANNVQGTVPAKVVKMLEGLGLALEKKHQFGSRIATRIEAMRRLASFL